MKISLTKRDNAHSILLSGSLNQQTLSKDFWLSITQEQYATLFNDDTCNKIILSLNEIEHIDTAGLAWLINLSVYAKNNSAELAYEGIPEKLMALASLSNARIFFE